MKQFKFRGKSKITGEIIYGDLSHYEGGSYIDDEAVYENSVAQFVGCDADGKEIYSDDRVFDLNGNERIVADILINFNSIGGHFANVTLKESQDETI